MKSEEEILKDLQDWAYKNTVSVPIQYSRETILEEGLRYPGKIKAVYPPLDHTIGQLEGAEMLLRFLEMNPALTLEKTNAWLTLQVADKNLSDFCRSFFISASTEIYILQHPELKIDRRKKYYR